LLPVSFSPKAIFRKNLLQRPLCLLKLLRLLLLLRRKRPLPPPLRLLLPLLRRKRPLPPLRRLPRRTQRLLLLLLRLPRRTLRLPKARLALRAVLIPIAKRLCPRS